MRPQYVFAVTAGLAVATSFASAATYSFTNITGNSATNAAAGEAQLSLSTLATANPQLVKISLTNGPGLASAVRCIFVDDSAGILAALGSISNTAGITFNAGTSGALPGGENVSFVANHSLGLTADPPPPFDGINPGETLEWTYTLAAGFTLADVDQAINDGLLRFGVHMIAWPNGGSEAFVTDPGTPVHMPTPLASVMGIAGLGVLGSRRHRTN